MKHHRTVLSTALAFAATILLQAMPNAPTDAYGAERQRTAEDREAARRWQYELRQLKQYGHNTKTATRGWHRNKRPRRGELIELDPPMPTSSPGRVEVELLFTYLADLPHLRPPNKNIYDAYGVQGWANTLAEYAWRHWWFQTISEELKSRIRPMLSPVGAMPGGNPALNDYHVEYQKMVMAWDPEKERRLNNPIHWELRAQLWRTRYIPAFDAEKTRDATEQNLERAGVPIEEWRRAATAETTIEQMRRNTERLAEITRRSRALDERYARPPRLAVILINGRYVLENSNIPKLTRRIQIMNHLVDRELDRLDKR